MDLADIERQPTYNASNAVLVTDGSDYEDGRESDTSAWDIPNNDVVFDIDDVVFKNGNKKKKAGTLPVHVLADANRNQTMTKLHKINSHLCRDANGNANNLFLGSQANNQTHKGIEAHIKGLLSPLEGKDYMKAGGGLVLKQIKQLDIFDDGEGATIHGALGNPNYSPWVPRNQDGKYRAPPDILKALNATVKAVDAANKGTLLSTANVNKMKNTANLNAILFWAIPDNDVNANILIAKYKTVLSAGKQHTALNITSKAKAETAIEDELVNTHCPPGYYLDSYDGASMDDAAQAYLDWLRKVHVNFESKLDHYTPPNPFFISSAFNHNGQQTSGPINIDPPRLWS
jgi:hypothetical protein